MDWWKPLGALAAALVAFVAAGGLVRLLRTVVGDATALVVAALVVVAVLAAYRSGTAPNRWLSNPYWGR